MNTPSAIAFTDNAAKRVHQLAAQEHNQQLMLRVYIEGGGCSGFQYGFELAEQAADDDTVNRETRDQVAG